MIITPVTSDGAVNAETVRGAESFSVNLGFSFFCLSSARFRTQNQPEEKWAYFTLQNNPTMHLFPQTCGIKRADQDYGKVLVLEAERSSRTRLFLSVKKTREEKRRQHEHWEGGGGCRATDIPHIFTNTHPNKRTHMSVLGLDLLWSSGPDPAGSLVQTQLVLWSRPSWFSGPLLWSAGDELDRPRPGPVLSCSQVMKDLISLLYTFVVILLSPILSRRDSRSHISSSHT